MLPNKQAVVVDKYQHILHYRKRPWANEPDNTTPWSAWRISLQSIRCYVGEQTSRDGRQVSQHIVLERKRLGRGNVIRWSLVRSSMVIGNLQEVGRNNDNSMIWWRRSWYDIKNRFIYADESIDIAFDQLHPEVQQMLIKKHERYTLSWQWHEAVFL